MKDIEKIVAMVEHKDFIFVATENNVYQVIDNKLELVPWEDKCRQS